LIDLESGSTVAARNVLLQRATLALHFWGVFWVIWGAKKGNLKTPKNSKKAALAHDRQYMNICLYVSAECADPGLRP
jgi:hypothetical protein